MAVTGLGRQESYKSVDHMHQTQSEHAVKTEKDSTSASGLNDFANQVEDNTRNGHSSPAEAAGLRMPTVDADQINIETLEEDLSLISEDFEINDMDKEYILFLLQLLTALRASGADKAQLKAAFGEVRRASTEVEKQNTVTKANNSAIFTMVASGASLAGSVVGGVQGARGLGAGGAQSPAGLAAGGGVGFTDIGARATLSTSEATKGMIQGSGSIKDGEYESKLIAERANKTNLDASIEAQNEAKNASEKVLEDVKKVIADFQQTKTDSLKSFRA